MPTSGFQGDVLSLVLHSGPMAQFIIFVLLGFSTVSWAIMVERYRVIQRSERESAAFVTKFRAGSSLGDLRDFAEKLPHAPAAAIYRAGFRQINAVGNPKVPAAAGPTRDPMASIERVLVRAATEEQARLERSLPFLATTAAACPFIGLFGTVWGIMEAFTTIGATGTTSITAVAPGISEALINTAAGLFAAVPALLAYNHFVQRLRQARGQMEDFTLEFLNLTERNFT